jgi:hypothetical protein
LVVTVLSLLGLAYALPVSGYDGPRFTPPQKKLVEKQA